MILYNPNAPIGQLFCAWQGHRDQANRDYQEYLNLPPWGPFKAGSNWGKFVRHMGYVWPPLPPTKLIKYFTPGIYKTLWFDTKELL